MQNIPAPRPFAVLLFLFSLLTTAQALEVGVNIISVGNEYATPEFQDERILPFLAQLKREGLARVSFRVTWSRMEPVEGAHNEAYLKNLKRLYDAAAQAGLKGLLDFHTLFKRNAYACPAWVSNYVDSMTGQRGTHSVAMIVRNPEVGRRYLAMQRHVAMALSGCAAIDAVSLMNEPFSLEWNKPASMRKEHEALTAFIVEAAAQMKAVAPPWKKTVRFCMPYQPWALDEAKRFDPKPLMEALEIFSLNNYLDPENAQDQRPTTGPASGTWRTFEQAADECRSAGKAFWVTEFGCPVDGEKNTEGSGGTVPSGGQARYFEAFFARIRGMPSPPSTVLAWVMSLGPLGKSPDSYALWDRASGRPTEGARALFKNVPR